MHPEEFLQQQKERNEKKKQRVILACIIICVIWIPIALLLYKPTFLFESGAQSDTISDNR